MAGLRRLGDAIDAAPSHLVPSRASRDAEGCALTLGFDLPTLAWIGLSTLVAFIVRGFSGFGSALIGIGSLTMVLPPAQVIPAFFCIELLTSVNLLPSVWRQIDWRSLRWVIGGCAVTTPLGLVLLAHIDPNAMRFVVSGCLATIATLMLTGVAQRFTPSSTPGRMGALAAGGASGVLNGAAGIPGPPAIVFYFATTGAAVSRATLIGFFVFTDVYGLAWAAGTGLLAGVGWKLIAAAVPFALLGLFIGHRLYG